MRIFSKKSLVLFLFIFALAVLPFQSGLCDCAVEGGVCGETPDWDPCCNPDKFECELESEDDAYGTCIPREEE